jgi:crotonobetainyl-CoA:carnitine CoA-transferase CaiB-like acyl-CoA transferase
MGARPVLAQEKRMAVLSGMRVVEFEGLGPGPFCGMLLADHGADVILIGRGAGAGKAAVFHRGKRSIALDLKDPKHVAAAAKIAATADAIIEGLRPGVMERLGLGPEVLMASNPKLVYGRITGWGQTGPLAHAAGHDINYAGLSGAAWYAGAAGAPPVPPPTLVGDVGGGALYLAFGILAGVLKARETGRGAVVDAAIVDGSAHMLGLLLSLRAAGGMPDARGQSMLDGAHYYDAYPCADGAWISIGPLEPKFYALLLEKLGLSGEARFAAQFDIAAWPARKAELAAIFASQPRAHWTALLEGTDVCFAPILSPGEAKEHPHIRARAIFREVDGVLHAAAAPRFDGVIPPNPKAPPENGADTDAILREAGLTRADLE